MGGGGLRCVGLGIGHRRVTDQGIKHCSLHIRSNQKGEMLPKALKGPRKTPTFETQQQKIVLAATAIREVAMFLEHCR